MRLWAHSLGILYKFHGKFDLHGTSMGPNPVGFGSNLSCNISPNATKFFTHVLTYGLFHVKCCTFSLTGVKIQLLPIHSKHMVLWPFGYTKLNSKILEREIIVNILKSSLKFSMEKYMVNGEDIFSKNSVTLTTSLLCYFSNWWFTVISIGLYYSEDVTVDFWTFRHDLSNKIVSEYHF